jgi:hypothetical protein
VLKHLEGKESLGASAIKHEDTHGLQCDLSRKEQRMSSALNRIACGLPTALKSLCETGCIFRDATLRHAACATALKTECAAPCYPEPCPCSPNPKMYKGRSGYKYYHEVQQVQEETKRHHIRMHM